MSAKRAKHRPTTEIPRATNTRRSWDIGLLVLVAAGFVGTLLLRPIDAPGTWWEISRGRAVLAGHIAPSQHLLVADERAESDWLGGVPFHAAYQTLGGTGLMLGRFAALLAVAGLVLAAGKVPDRALASDESSSDESSGDHSASGQIGGWFAAAGLVAVSPALQPTGLLWDVLGTASLFVVTVRCHPRPNASREVVARCAMIALVVVTWANLGPRFVVAPAVWLSAAWLLQGDAQSSFFHRARLAELAAILISGSINPRGVLAWWDSCRLLTPSLFSIHATAVDPGWGPLGSAAWSVPALVTVGLWCLIVLLPLTSSRMRQALLGGTLLSGIASTICAANLPWCAAWLAVLLHAGWRRSLPRIFARDLTRGDGKGRARASKLLQSRIGLALGIALLASGLASERPADHWGWGLDAALDPRLLATAVGDAGAGEVAWSDHLAAVGMWCHLRAGGAAAYDTPHRALLGGRLESMRLLADDLREARQFFYLREDGSSGGWWLQLNQQDIDVLLVPAGDLRLLRALAPTIWQPIVLDSPILAHARAGSESFREPLLRSLSQREFVEFGAWNYEGVGSTASDFDRDRWLESNPADAERIALRQARVFHALGLRMAASRVLTWLRGHTNSAEADCETVTVHRAWLHEEDRESGAALACRQAILAEAARDPRVTELGCVPLDAIPQVSENALLRSAAAYLRGDRDAAARELSEDGAPQHRIAAAWLRWEAGDVEQAIRGLESAGSSDSSPEHRLARYWLDRLQIPEARNASGDPHVKPDSTMP